MRRIAFFGLVLGIALSAFLLILLWYLSMFGSMSMSNFGRTGGMTSTMMVESIFGWFVFLVVIGLVIIGVLGVSYYAAFPEIKPWIGPYGQVVLTNPVSPQRMEQITRVSKTVGAIAEVEGQQRQREPTNGSFSVILKTSTPEEQKVLSVLKSHEGKHLQKLIVKESGLSRLRTHRIIARFAERGILKVSKSGNTNEVEISPWLNQESSLAGAVYLLHDGVPKK